ncbi:hypothetical protein GQ457_15G011870 [Hibiscus cannabinus]
MHHVSPVRSDSLSKDDSMKGADKDNFISALDVDLQADDVVIGNNGVLPKICFSKRVHRAINENLFISLIMHLLGKSIGYQALKNHIQSLWNPKGEILFWGNVMRIYFNTTEGSRGRFVCSVVVINFDKPLIPSVVIEGWQKSVEYERLLLICFSCGKYRHSKYLCCGIETPKGKEQENKRLMKIVDDMYGPWMHVSGQKRQSSVT